MTCPLTSRVMPFETIFSQRSYTLAAKLQSFQVTFW